MKLLSQLGLFGLSVSSSALATSSYQDQQRLMPQQSDSSPNSAFPGKPNIIVIIVDDQDLQLDSLSYMPILDRELRQKGSFYSNHFVTTALCCPSRVSLWTGKQAHNTNVTDVKVPHGGYPKFVKEGHNENWLPVWLQNAGYNTYYVGKLFNMHNVDNYDAPFVKGFTGSDFLLDPWTYSYMNSTYQRNKDPPVSYEGFHTVDVTAIKSYGFLSDALAKDEPFFLTIAPVAPHSNSENQDLSKIGQVTFTPPIPQPRYSHLFRDAKVPRTEHFNPDKPSGVNWVRELPKQSEKNVEANDVHYRRRLQALQGPDEIVGNVIRMLEQHNALENTYIIYTSDNGYHIGQHRLQPGKECGFDEDIRVPMFIRGPGVPAGRRVDSVSTHIDIAPTIFHAAGIEPLAEFDGTSMPLTVEEIDSQEFQRHEHVGVEFWGIAVGETGFGWPDGSNAEPGGAPYFHLNNTYKALRVLGEGYDLYYSVWCNNEHELYDLKTDPFELHNLYPATLQAGDEVLLMGHPITQGITCIKPWDVLHPEGDVTNLKDALSSAYDTYYLTQVKIAFNRCEAGYIIDAEGPQEPLIYRDGVHWSEFV